MYMEAVLSLTPLSLTPYKQLQLVFTKVSFFNLRVGGMNDIYKQELCLNSDKETPIVSDGKRLQTVKRKSSIKIKNSENLLWGTHS